MLDISGLTKRFGPVLAVDGISLSVARGEIVSLLGPSGCGKTTILRLIAGFETPDAGTIRLAGQDVAALRPYERNVGLLFQSYALFPHMTLRDNIAFGLRHRGWPKERIGDRIAEMLRLVKLGGLEGRYPGQLSGGQEQRVALARALATEPEVLLLDEPLSALDAKLRHELRTEIKEILRTVRSTTIIVTHDQEEAMGMAERILVLRSGRIEQEGTPDAVYCEPRNRFVAEFVGRSNWFSGSYRAAGEAHGEVETDCGLVLAVPRRNGMAETAGGSNRCDVGVRPERIDLLPGGSQEAAAAGENRIEGAVTDVALLGADRHVTVDLGAAGFVVAVEQNRQATVRTGDAVSVRFLAGDCILLPQERN